MIRQVYAFIGKHLALPIQRQMIAVFAAQDMRHKRGAHKALWNGAAWHLGLHDRLTTCAGQPWALDLVYNVVAGYILQLFHDICAQLFEVAAAVGAGVTGGDPLLDALETLGEWLACAVCGAALLYPTTSVNSCTLIWCLSGLFDLKFFKDQFQRQLRAAL